MIKLCVNKNGTVTNLNNGTFAIGKLDEILELDIYDKLIIEKLKFSDTVYSKDAENLYSYGNFDKQSDINNLTLNLAEGASVSIVSGVSENESNCLKCTTVSDKGFGLIELTPDKKDIFKENTTYLISFYAKGINSAIKIKDETNTFIEINVNNACWTKYTQQFTAGTVLPSMLVENTTNTPCTIYLDTIQMYEMSCVNERPEYIAYPKIVAINPCPKITIDNLISRRVDEFEDGSERLVLLFNMPAITNVDIFNNITCQVVIEEEVPKRVSALGNMLYNEYKNILFLSEKFTLNGYLIKVATDIDVNLKVEDI